MAEHIKCPYCQKVNELKYAKSGQHLPYMRCLGCNLLIWFYGGVPNKKSAVVVANSERPKPVHKERSIFPLLNGGGE